MCPVVRPVVLAREFLALGADVEVLAPPELRARLAETVRALAARYGSTASDG
ncbi:WYL domain-containing protein [Streptomyces sp. MnatMP-M17]|uniref:WYL domain-containing protein n=1 Tax=unclassified Streptomyces TaxID=2593676 RepID=UPI00210D8404|nr:WYL domain-containing protein [Streptomyces sp. MnatMP-M17]